MEQAPVAIEQTAEQKERFAIQIAIIRSMIRRGIIKSATEYVDNGHAAAFELFYDGIARCATDKEVEAVSQQARALIGRR